MNITQTKVINTKMVQTNTKDSSTHGNYGNYIPLGDLENNKVEGVYDMKYSQFINGYDVVSEEVDDSEVQSSIRWITCKNGCYGRSHELSSMIERGKRDFDKQIVEDGIFDGTTTYFINPDKYYYYGIVEAISIETHRKQMKSKGSLQDILSKYNKYLCNVFSEQDHTNKWFTNTLKLDNLLAKNNQSILSSGQMMMTCLRCERSKKEVEELDDIFKTKLGLTEQQLALCGFN